MSDMAIDDVKLLQYCPGPGREITCYVLLILFCKLVILQMSYKFVAMVVLSALIKKTTRLIIDIQSILNHCRS